MCSWIHERGGKQRRDCGSACQNDVASIKNCLFRRNRLDRESKETETISEFRRMARGPAPDSKIGNS